MVDNEIILAKASSVTKHLKRLKEKARLDLNAFLEDTDSQDVALFNIQMAVQNCIDIVRVDSITDGFKAKIDDGLALKITDALRAI